MSDRQFFMACSLYLIVNKELFVGAAFLAITAFLVFIEIKAGWGYANKQEPNQ